MNSPSHSTSQQVPQELVHCGNPSPERFRELMFMFNVPATVLLADTEWVFCLGCEGDFAGGQLPGFGLNGSDCCRMCGREVVHPIDITREEVERIFDEEVKQHEQEAQ